MFEQIIIIVLVLILIVVIVTKTRHAVRYDFGPPPQPRIAAFLTGAEFDAIENGTRLARAELYDQYREFIRRAIDGNINERHAFDEAVFMATRANAMQQMEFDDELTIQPITIVPIVEPSINTPKAEVAGQKLELAKVQVSDPQNVHDSAVVKGLQQMYGRLRQIPAGHSDAIVAEIRDAVLTSAMTEQRKLDALRVIDRVESSPSRVISLGDTDYNVLLKVWERSKLPTNTSVANSMRNALVEALADCVEGEGAEPPIVCSNGRVARFLGSLTLLDTDPAMSAPQTSNQYRNDALDFAHNLLEKTLDKYAAGDAQHVLLARSYREVGKEIVVPDAIQAEFKKELESAVDTYISENKANLPSNIKMELMAGLT
jgi:hypothetical protein